MNKTESTITSAVDRDEGTEAVFPSWLAEAEVAAGGGGRGAADII